MSCPHKILPFPYEFCEGCLLNGCYPWNHNPLLLCGLLGGLLPIIQVTKDSETIPRQCLEYKPVTEEMWLCHLSDLKREAKMNEEMRKRAMRGDAYSSELMPAEHVQAHTGCIGHLREAHMRKHNKDPQETEGGADDTV